MRTLLLLGAVLLLAGAAIYHFTLPGPESAPPTVPSYESRPEGVELPTKDFLSGLTQNKERSSASGAAQVRQTPAAPLAWESAVVNILQDPSNEATRGAQILALLPSLPEEALEPVTEQALPWVHDTDYPALVLPLLLNVQTDGPVLSVLFRDLMERPGTLALPTLLTLARLPEHPLSTAAHENLTLAMGEDMGEDWPAWEEAVKQRLGGEVVPALPPSE